MAGLVAGFGTLLWVVGSVVGGLLLVALLVPVAVHAWGTVQNDRLFGVAELRWGGPALRLRVETDATAQLSLFGLPLWKGPLSTFAGGPGEKQPKPASKKEERRKRRKPAPSPWRPSDWPQLLRLGGTARAMLARGVRSVHPRLAISGTLGLGDPEATAWARAVGGALDHLGKRGLTIDLRDELLEETLALDGRVSLWVLPGELVRLALIWMLRNDTRTVLRLAWP